MKKTILAICLSMAGAAFAQEGVSDRAKAKEKCELVATLAAQYMELRQLGAPMSEVLTDPDFDLQNYYVTKAYKMPKFPESMKAEVIEDFKNEAFLECYTALTRPR